MGSKKEKKTQILKNKFFRKKVLDIAEVKKILNVTGRTSVYEYLKELKYFSSYTHSCRYYTIEGIPIFDKSGLWHFGEIGFSKHGTLKETILNAIKESPSGKLCSELEKLQRVRARDALLDLVKANEITRDKQGGVYVYTDPNDAKEQIACRNRTNNIKELAVLDIISVLVCVIQSVPGKIPNSIQVSMQLQKQGLNITPDAVKKVFEDYDLEKKLRI